MALLGQLKQNDLYITEEAKLVALEAAEAPSPLQETTESAKLESSANKAANPEATEGDKLQLNTNISDEGVKRHLDTQEPREQLGVDEPRELFSSEQLQCQLCDIVCGTRLQLLEHYSDQHLRRELSSQFSDLGKC